MKPTTTSEVLVLLVFLATVPASLATDRASSCTRYVDIATSHESNSDLSNQLRRVRFLKEGEKIKLERKIGNAILKTLLGKK